MTQERENYLASISKEERAIRETIEFHNMEIADEKFYINYYKKINGKRDKYIILAKEKIVKHKAIIKALKKQLPAPRVSCTCSVCGAALIHWSGDELNYCLQCGQKLR